MGPDAVQELLAALRPRYAVGSKADKGRMLDEFCANTGYHRKAAIRALKRRPRASTSGRHLGRPPKYDRAVLLPVLIKAWEASGYICGKRLAPFMDEMLASLVRHQEISDSTAVRSALGAMSAATIDRWLSPVRKARRRQPRLRHAPVSDLAHMVATHTFGDLRGQPLGHLEVDLVLHCGMTTAGFYLTTLVGVDILTGWCECVAVWGKGQDRVGAALARLRSRLPFPLRGIHSDNGSEFLNEKMYTFCKREEIAFSHSRPYRKNDQPRVEQRNGSLVRQLIGEDRYTSHAAHQQLNLIYGLLHYHTNFFQPIRKLTGYEPRGDHFIKRYDEARTPYQRLLAAYANLEHGAELQQLYESLDPLDLQHKIEEGVGHLWRLAAIDPASEQAVLTKSTTVASRSR